MLNIERYSIKSSLTKRVAVYAAFYLIMLGIFLEKMFCQDGHIVYCVS